MNNDDKDTQRSTLEPAADPDSAAATPDAAPRTRLETISRRGLVAGVVALPVLMRSGSASAQATTTPVKLNPASLTGAKAVQTRTTLFTALDKISKDQKLVTQFSKQPVDALNVVGWSTDKNFPAIDSRAIANFTNRVQAHNPAALTVCGSVGCIVCASVGGDT
jgi:hypothetical protein